MRRLRIEHAPTTLSGDVLLLSVLTVVLLGVGLGAITVADTVRGSSGDRASADVAGPPPGPSADPSAVEDVSDVAEVAATAGAGGASVPPDAPLDGSIAPWMVPTVGSLLHGSRFGDVDGFLVFRGNPTRTFYGEGPVPREPAIVWSAPSEGMCSVEVLPDERKVWCGIGWTGQVVLLDRGGDGLRDVEVMVGGYDGSFHLFDGATGERTRPPFVTGAMVKGTESLVVIGHLAIDLALLFYQPARL